jgi:hypothetical protein
MQGIRRSFLPLAVVAAFVAALAACGGTSEETTKKGDHLYRGYRVSFRYPRDWHQIASKELKSSNGTGLWTVTFEPAKSSGVDIAFLTKYRTPVAITKKNLVKNKRAITSAVADVAQQSGGSLVSGPHRSTMGGLPGYGFRINTVTIDGAPTTSRVLLVWKGKTEYYLNCQYLTKGTMRKVIERGCRMIISSFRQV